MRMKAIGRSKVSKMSPKPTITYPFIRLPQDCGDVIGQTVGIYETEHEGRRAFMLIMDDNTTLPSKVIQCKTDSSLEKRINSLEINIENVIRYIDEKEGQNSPKIAWARRDSNTRSSPCEGDVIAS